MFTFHIGHLIVQKKFKADPASKKLKDFCKYQNAKKISKQKLEAYILLEEIKIAQTSNGYYQKYKWINLRVGFLKTELRICRKHEGLPTFFDSNIDIIDIIALF